MATGRLKIKRGGVVHVEPGAGTLRAPGEEVVDIGERGGLLKVVRTLVTLLVATVLVIIAVYVALAATLMRAVPEGGGNFTWIKNATFVGGIPSPGTYAYVSTKGVADNGLMGKLHQAFIGVDGGAVMVIIAGPAGTVDNGSNGNILWNGKDTGFAGNVNQGSALTNEYLAICIDQECKPGGIYRVPIDAIVGEAQYHIESRTISPYSLPSTGK